MFYPNLVILHDEFTERFIESWNKVDLFNNCSLHVFSNEFSPEKLPEHVDKYVQTYKTKKDVESLNIKEELKVIPYLSWRAHALLELRHYSVCQFIFMDTKCLPLKDEKTKTILSGESFINSHLKMLSGRGRWLITGMKGEPFFNCGEDIKNGINVGFSLYDCDRPYTYSLHNQNNVIPDFKNHIVPKNMYLPLSFTNISFSDEIAWLLYNPFGSCSFGDVWTGVIIKKIFDQFNLTISYGTPYVLKEEEFKNSDSYFEKIKEEVNYLNLNEYFWSFIDKIDINDCKNQYDAYVKIAKELPKFYEQNKQFADQFASFINKSSENMLLWSQV